MLRLNLNYLCRSVFLSAAVFAGCAFGVQAQDNSTVAAAPQATLPAQIASPQSADWRNEIGTFKVGLVRGWSSDMSRLALSRVENVFAKALGIPVKVVVFERFTSLMDAQADGRIDLAAYSARAFATMRLMCECVDALATPTISTGQTGQVAILVGDKLRKLSLTDIGTSKIGRIATTRISNDDMLRGTLMINGKPVTGKEEFWLDFPDYAAAMQAYQTKMIDGFVIPAAASFDAISEAGIAELNLMQMSKTNDAARPVSALWRSSFWPYGPIAVRSNLAADAKALVLRTLEQLDVTEPLAHATLSEGLAGAFRKSDLAGYANVSASIRLLVSQNANWR
jgi:phosphonate transport system substrate-binding protein